MRTVCLMLMRVCLISEDEEELGNPTKGSNISLALL